MWEIGVILVIRWTTLGRNLHGRKWTRISCQPTLKDPFPELTIPEIRQVDVNKSAFQTLSLMQGETKWFIFLFLPLFPRRAYMQELNSKIVQGQKQ